MGERLKIESDCNKLGEKVVFYSNDYTVTNAVYLSEGRSVFHIIYTCHCGSVESKTMPGSAVNAFLQEGRKVHSVAMPEQPRPSGAEGKICPDEILQLVEDFRKLDIVELALNEDMP